MKRSPRTKIDRLASLLAIGALALAGGSGPVLAAYDGSVTWADMSAIDIKPALSSQYASPTNLYEPAIPESAYELVLRDADSRVSQEFRVPPSLRPLVAFWLRVYTQYTSEHVVVCDSRHPELVYDVLDFRELARSSRNRAAYEIVSKKRVKKAVAAFRGALRELSRNPRPAHPTPEQKKILAAVRKFPHRHPFKELARHVRTQTGQRDNIMKGLLAARVYLPKMETIFSRMGVPLELTRLPLVESSFDMRAFSRKGAVGIWQFMRDSGREYLVIDDRARIDERLSPLKATVAAAKLLKRNRRVLGSWALAVTSFNHGMRGLPRLGRGQTGDEPDLAPISHLFSPCAGKGRHLGWAGRNYFAEFLAVVHADAYRQLFYGEPPASITKAWVFKRAKPGLTAAQLASRFHLKLGDFQLLNPDVRDLRRPLPAGFWVAVPGDSDDLAGLTEDASPRARRSRQT